MTKKNKSWGDVDPKQAKEDILSFRAELINRGYEHDLVEKDDDKDDKVLKTFPFPEGMEEWQKDFFKYVTEGKNVDIRCKFKGRRKKNGEITDLEPIEYSIVKGAKPDLIIIYEDY